MMMARRRGLTDAEIENLLDRLELEEKQEGQQGNDLYFEDRILRSYLNAEGQMEETLSNLLAEPREQALQSRLAIFYNMEQNKFGEDAPEWLAPECPARVQKILEKMEEEGIFAHEFCTTITTDNDASKEDILLVHPEEYVNKVQGMVAQAKKRKEKEVRARTEETRDMWRKERVKWASKLFDKDGEVWWDEHAFSSASTGVGGFIKLLERVRQYGGAGINIQRPPTHHARREAWGGFCFINGTAVAVEIAVRSNFK